MSRPPCGPVRWSGAPCGPESARGPLADARVTLIDAAGNVVATATTGEDGAYAFTDLDAGEYTVIATGYPPVAGSSPSAVRESTGTTSSSPTRASDGPSRGHVLLSTCCRAREEHVLT